jgi:hypothetical protein
MRDNQNTGPALSSDAVDARFWALICDDEEWLRAEFDGIVSEPAEHPTAGHPGRSPGSTGTNQPGSGGKSRTPVHTRGG